ISSDVTLFIDPMHSPKLCFRTHIGTNSQSAISFNIGRISEWCIGRRSRAGQFADRKIGYDLLLRFHKWTPGRIDLIHPGLGVETQNWLTVQPGEASSEFTSYFNILGVNLRQQRVCFITLLGHSLM